MENSRPLPLKWRITLLAVARNWALVSLNTVLVIGPYIIGSISSWITKLPPTLRRRSDSAMLAGALVLLGPVLLKTRLGVDEVVTTLLMNFIMLLFVNTVAKRISDTSLW